MHSSNTSFKEGKRNPLPTCLCSSTSHGPGICKKIWPGMWLYKKNFGAHPRSNDKSLVAENPQSQNTLSQAMAFQPRPGRIDNIQSIHGQAVLTQANAAACRLRASSQLQKCNNMASLCLNVQDQVFLFWAKVTGSHPVHAQHFEVLSGPTAQMFKDAHMNTCSITALSSSECSECVCIYICRIFPAYMSSPRFVCIWQPPPCMRTLCAASWLGIYTGPAQLSALYIIIYTGYKYIYI